MCTSACRDRAEAARWYAEHLGFEPVDAYDFWATGFAGGPLQISADGGRTTLALFEATESHPMASPTDRRCVQLSTRTVSCRSPAHCPAGSTIRGGEPLVLTELVDFDLCWAFNFIDPWRNQYELNCYDYDRVRAELVEADVVKVDRYWPCESTRRTSIPSRSSRTEPATRRRCPGGDAATLPDADLSEVHEPLEMSVGEPLLQVHAEPRELVEHQEQSERAEHDRGAADDERIVPLDPSERAAQRGRGAGR